jgi:hypothetical protein
MGADSVRVGGGKRSGKRKGFSSPAAGWKKIRLRAEEGHDRTIVAGNLADYPDFILNGVRIITPAQAAAERAAATPSSG